MRVHIALAVATAIAVNGASAQDVKRSSPLTKPPSRTDVPASLPLKFVGPPTTGAITPLDLMTRRYKFADDSMLGRLYAAGPGEARFRDFRDEALPEA